MKKFKMLWTMMLLSAMPLAHAQEYFLAYADCGDTAPVYANRLNNGKNRLIAQLDFDTPRKKIVSKHGTWYRIELSKGKFGFVEQGQGFVVKDFIVHSPDGFANLREAHGEIINKKEEPIAQRNVLKKIPNGTRVQIEMDNNHHHKKWGRHIQRKNGDYIEGFIHRSLLKPVK